MQTHSCSLVQFVRRIPGHLQKLHVNLVNFTFLKLAYSVNCIIIFQTKGERKMAKDKKTKGKSCVAFYFLAATLVTTAAVFITIKEGRRIKKENELLSYEVW